MKQRKSSYDKAEILACGEGTLFEENSPRLPTKHMLMVDRITHISDQGGSFGRGEVIAELDISPEQWFFGCHFKDDPVMPGCLGLDAMWQLLGFFMAWHGHPGRGRALGARRVQFTGEVFPETKCVSYHIHIKRMIDRSLTIGFADGFTMADGRTIYSANGLQVGLLNGSGDRSRELSP